MFTFTHPNSLRRIFARSALVLTVFFCLSVVFLITGCDSNSDADDGKNIEGTLPDGLLGKWVSGVGDWFGITRSSGTETIEYDDDYDGSGNYEGIVRYVSNYDSKTGVIIIEYTTPSLFSDPAKNYHAIYYLNLTSGIVELSNTWDPSASDWNADTVTLDEAVNKFTKKNMGNYMDLDMSTPYTKS